MTSTAKKILSEALALPQDEREALLGELSVSLDPVQLSPEWDAEIARRMQKIASREAVFHDVEDHLQKLRAKYGS